MNFNFVDYCQYLLKSHTNFTITNLANHLENISHDTIYALPISAEISTMIVF